MKHFMINSWENKSSINVYEILKCPVKKKMDDNNGKENGLYEIKSSLKIDRSRENDAIYLRTN